MSEVPARFRESKWTLIRRTIGDREAIRGKVERALHALANYAFPSRIRGRLHKLRELGHVERVPNRTQMIFGSLDMFRHFIVPCAADYYRSKDITFSFHALLRFLDDPASMMDPTGFMSHRDAIIGHLMQVTHADPIYDLQLLALYDGGLDELERQIEQMIAGTHPRTESIGAIIEDPSYHGRLLAHVREFRADPDHCKPLRRENIEGNPRFQDIAETFGNLYTAIEYFASLPSTPLAAFLRFLKTRTFTKPVAALETSAAANDPGLAPEVRAA